jgi:hypothetical protein
MQDLVQRGTQSAFRRMGGGAIDVIEANGMRDAPLPAISS